MQVALSGGQVSKYAMTQAPFYWDSNLFVQPLPEFSQIFCFQPQRGADSSEQKIFVSYRYRPLNICAACAMTSIFTLKCEIMYHLYDDSSLLDFYDNKSCEIIRINHLIKKLSLDLFKNHI